MEINFLEMVKMGEYSDIPTKRLMTNPPPILPFLLLKKICFEIFNISDFFPLHRLLQSIITIINLCTV